MDKRRTEFQDFGEPIGRGGAPRDSAREAGAAPRRRRAAPAPVEAEVGGAAADEGGGSGNGGEWRAEAPRGGLMPRPRALFSLADALRKYTPLILGLLALVGGYLVINFFTFLIGAFKDYLIILMSFVAGAGGYYFVHFVVHPILRYYDIRHAVTSDLFYYANAIAAKDGGEALRRRQSERQDANRKHAAEIIAIYYRLPAFYRFWIKRCGEDPLDASRSLIGLANSVNDDQAYPHIKRMVKSLNISGEIEI